MAHEVRIIGGSLRRSRLPVPDLDGLRPTPDRVRETLFNWLGDLQGWRVMDAFAGTGALGLEAASRGAAKVLLVERSARAAASLRQTRDRLGLQGQVEVLQGDFRRALEAAAPSSLDLLLIDPPFDAPALRDEAVRLGIDRLVPGGWLFVESDEPWQPAEGGPLVPYRQARAGAVHYHLARRAAGAAPAPVQQQEQP